MQIHVKEIHPPKAGKKNHTVVAEDGQRYSTSEKVAKKLLVNRLYEAETTSWDYQGKTCYGINAATLVNGTVAGAASHAAPPFVPATGEGDYVGNVVSALLLKGEIQPKEIAAYTKRLREVWRETDPAANNYSEAAE